MYTAQKSTGRPLRRIPLDSRKSVRVRRPNYTVEVFEVSIPPGPGVVAAALWKPPPGRAGTGGKRHAPLSASDKSTSSKRLKIEGSGINHVSNVAGVETSGTDASQQPFRFLDLPPELRLEVYSYLIPQDREITGFNQPDLDETSHDCVNLMLTNKQVYDEVVTEIYGRAQTQFTIDISHNLSKIYFCGNAIAVPQLADNSKWTNLSKIKSLRLNIPLWHGTRLQFTKIRSNIQALVDRLTRGHNISQLEVAFYHSDTLRHVLNNFDDHGTGIIPDQLGLNKPQLVVLVAQPLYALREIKQLTITGLEDTPIRVIGRGWWALSFDRDRGGNWRPLQIPASHQRRFRKFKARLTRAVTAPAGAVIDVRPPLFVLTHACLEFVDIVARDWRAHRPSEIRELKGCAQRAGENGDRVALIHYQAMLIHLWRTTVSRDRVAAPESHCIVTPLGEVRKIRGAQEVFGYLWSLCPDMPIDIFLGDAKNCGSIEEACAERDEAVRLSEALPDHVSKTEKETGKARKKGRGRK